MFHLGKNFAVIFTVFALLTACSSGGSSSSSNDRSATESGDNGGDTGGDNGGDTGGDTNGTGEPAVQRDVDYGKTNRNKLDIYQPSDICNANRPTVFFMHGGGFTSGNKNGVVDLAEAANARDLNFVSINYRLTGHNPVLSSQFQTIRNDVGPQIPSTDPALITAAVAAIEDAVDALNFLAANANRYCLDMSRLAYWGESAGAYTVLSLAYSMDNFGVSRPAPDVVINYWGDLPLDEHLDSREAPFLTIHGDNDTTVAYQSAIDLATRADAIGVPYTTYTEIGGNHGVDISNTVDGVTLLVRTMDFITAHIVGGTALYEAKNLD